MAELFFWPLFFIICLYQVARYAMHLKLVRACAFGALAGSVMLVRAYVLAVYGR